MNETFEPLSYVATVYRGGFLDFPSLNKSFFAETDLELQTLVIDHIKTYVEAGQPIPVDEADGNGLRYFILPETSRYIRKYNEQFEHRGEVV